MGKLIKYFAYNSCNCTETWTTHLSNTSQKNYHFS